MCMIDLRQVAPSVLPPRGGHTYNQMFYEFKGPAGQDMLITDQIVCVFRTVHNAVCKTYKCVLQLVEVEQSVYALVDRFSSSYTSKLTSKLALIYWTVTKQFRTSIVHCTSIDIQLKVFPDAANQMQEASMLGETIPCMYKLEYLHVSVNIYA